MNAVSDAASRLFTSQLRHLSALVANRLELEWRYHERPDLERADRHLLEYAVEFGRLLNVVYKHQLHAALREECTWYAAVFGARGSRHDAFALVLDSWIMAVQGLLEPPQCNELAEPIQAIRSDLEAVLREASRLRIAAGAAVEPALLDALVAGDVRGARRVIADLASTFPSPDHLIVEVVLPAMAEIGRRWELNELEIFQEHLATEAIRRLLAGLAATVPDTRQKPGAVALVSCAPGDEHELIPLALSSYLECRHWTVKNLGVGLPPDQLARAVAVLEPAVLFLTVTMLSRLDDALDAIESVQRESGRCRIIAGGRGAVLARAVLEDRKVLVALDFADGLRLAEERSLDA